jgi:cyclopropane-fatty-acyl-phospholipid synthase
LSTKEEIAVSYDVSNDFFRLWLDKRMVYTCALFENTNDLDTAQFNKLKWFYEAVKAAPDKRLLDIGCGWGGTMEFFAQEMGVKDVTGITLSRAQYEQIQAKSLPALSVECVSYRDYQPNEKFDAVVSIGMFEHIATSQQAIAGEHVSLYRDYFRRAWEWTTPGAWFALQSVISLRVPRKPIDVREIGWVTSTIFPGAITPRLEAILSSALPYWEVMEIHTRRDHYAKTTTEWLQRLCNHQEIIEERWGKEKFSEYNRYLNACIMAFEKGYQSLVQIAMRRIDS